MRKILLLLVLLAPALLYAQNFLTLTGTHTYGGGGQLLPMGTILMQPVDSSGNPIGYQAGGGGQQTRNPTVCAVVAGVIQQPCQVANTSHTNPVNVCFALTIKDSSNKIIIGGPGSGYMCVQPQTTNFWCAVGSCNLDQYVPNVSAATMALLGPPQPLQLGSIYSGSCDPGFVAIGYDTNGRVICTPQGGSSGGVLDPGANGLMFRDALNTTRPALPTDISTLLGYTPADNTGVVHLANSETIPGIKTFTNGLVGNLTGVASAASALDHLPTSCGVGLAARGITAVGDATGCFSLTAGLGDPGANSIVFRSAFNTTRPAIGSDIVAVIGYTPSNDSTVVHNTGNENVNGVKTFGNTIIATAGMTGTASNASALAGTPTLCAAGSAPRGILNTGDATQCGLLGIGDPGSNGVLKRTAQNVTGIAGPSDINAALGYTAANDALAAHLANPETFTGAKTFNLASIESGVTNRTGNYLPLLSAANASPLKTLIMDAPNGHLQLQADSGAGANLGGQISLQSTNGPNGIASASVTVGSSGIQVDATGMTIFTANGLKTVITGPGGIQIGNVGGIAGTMTFVGNVSGSKSIGCSDSACTSFSIGGPLSLGTPLAAIYGGTGFTDFSFSGGAHKVASVTGTLTSGGCAQFDGSGNLTALLVGCGTGSGGLVDPGSNGVLKRTALNTTAIAGASDINGSLGYTAANDALVVHLAGPETIAGVKTFSSLIGGSISGNSATSTAFDHNPTDCGAGAAANTIDASGNLGGCIAVPVASNANPLVNGAAAPGTGAAFSRSDHVHPTDTSRAADSAVVHLASPETITGLKTFSGGLAGVLTGSLVGNASTATTATTASALVGPTTNCSANNATTGINASGAAQGCFAPVLLAGDLANTAAAPRVTSTHISGTALNALMRADTNGNMVNSGWSDDLTTSTYNGTGAGLDGLVFGADQGVQAGAFSFEAPTVGTAHVLVMPGNPVSGLLHVSTSVSPTGCVATGTKLCGVYGPVDVSGADITGLGGVANGFTGVNTIPTHAIMLGRAAAAIATLAPAGTGQALISGGITTDPSYNFVVALGGNGSSTQVSGNGQLIIRNTTGAAVTIQNASGSSTAYNKNLAVGAGSAGQPSLSGGGGSSPETWGNISGNTTTFITGTGTLPGVGCGEFDISGNLRNTGTACGSGSGGVGTSVVPRLAYYDTPTTVNGAANSAIGDGATSAVLTLTGTSLAHESLLVNCTTPGAHCFGVQIGGTDKLFIDSSGFIGLNSGTINALAGATYKSTTGAGSIDYTSGTDGTNDATSSTATFRGAKMTSANANGAGTAALAGGDLTNTGAATGLTGALGIRGGNCLGTGACTIGDLTISPGALTNVAPNASAVEGRIVFNSSVFKKGTTVTAGNAACISASETIADCLTTGANPVFIGVQSTTAGGSAYVQTAGTATLNLDASSTWSAGDIVCISATGAALFHMNGTTVCVGRRAGFARSSGSAATTVKTALLLN